MKTIFLSFSLNNRSLTDFFLTLSNKLAEKFHVVIITDKIEPHPFKVSSRITIYKWPSARPTKHRDFVFLFKKVREHKPVTMISMYGAVNIFLIVGYIMRVKNRIAWYHTISSQIVTTNALKWRKKLFYRLATKFFANSICSKADLHEYFKIPEHKVTVAYNAIRTGTRSRFTDINKIVFAGRLHPSKGIDTLISAMPEVLKVAPDLKLVIIGGILSGNVIKQYIAQAAVVGVSTNIDFRGYLPSEAVRSEFAEAYVTIVPSLFEAFGFVVIESFSVMTPVIGSNTSGIAEIIRDGKDGFLFEPGNEKDLAEKIIHLLQHPKLRETFSANCFERLQDKFEIEAVTDVLFAEISSL